MQNRILRVLGVCLVGGTLLCGCSSSLHGEPIEIEDEVIQKAEGVRLGGEEDLVEHDVENKSPRLSMRNKDEGPAVPDEDGGFYARSEQVYGIRFDVPANMMFDKENLENHSVLCYYDLSDGADVSYIEVEVYGDAWGDIVSIDELTPDKAVYEDVTVSDDGANGAFHYFFVTDKTNAGEHEMQVLVHMTAKNEKALSRELVHVAKTMDLSNFYYDNFS